MTDDEIETMICEMIETSMATPERELALEWLHRRGLIFAAMDQLGLIDDQMFEKEESRC